VQVPQSISTLSGNGYSGNGKGEKVEPVINERQQGPIAFFFRGKS